MLVTENIISSIKRRVIGSCIKSKENNENNQIRLLFLLAAFFLLFVFFALFSQSDFLAEFLTRNFVTCRRRQRALIRSNEHKIRARTCLLYPLPRRFHRYVFRVFHFFLSSSLMKQIHSSGGADSPLKPEEDFLRAH